MAFVGAVTLSLVPVVIKSRIGAGIEVETAINLFFAIGIAAGSLLAALIAHGRIRLGPAPYFLLIMAALLIDLGLTAGALPEAKHEIVWVDFFTSPVGLHILIAVLALSTVSGLFVVPIFAAVQAWAGEDRRARVIGAVNTMSAIYMVVGSLATTLLLKLAGLTEPGALTVLGIVNILAAGYFLSRLPQSSN